MDKEELLGIILRAKENNKLELDLRGEGIRELPPEIGQIKSLTRLHLGKTTITKQEYVGIGYGETDEFTYDYPNYLTTLPAEVGDLENLEYLDLSDNTIIELPSEILRLKKLKHLFLSGNNLKIPPEILGSVCKIQKLD